ncbi:DUF3107 domain-containing protein [Microbacterium suaedae]|uniref:DUF3107 domain-containing protein n=1 Tax=Microbacterium suaedae TaxID=2067813 RepID=UPI000DA1A202|nr:DUF3107 domain-containing protein [Microbacterium suaedae]
MDIRIGMMNTGRELSFTSDETAEAVATKVDEALTKETSLSLTDEKGTRYIIPSGALAFVEVGSEETRRVGFVA